MVERPTHPSAPGAARPDRTPRRRWL